MARLVRPTIPLAVKLRVLLRQLGDAFPDEFVLVATEEGSLGLHVHEKQRQLAELLGAADGDRIDYDHNPALGARAKVFKDGVHVDYDPPANDPDHIYAELHSEHRLKTNVRGKNGQHPDRVLIKRQRRREREEQEARGLRKPKPKARIRSRPFPKVKRKINWRKP